MSRTLLAVVAIGLIVLWLLSSDCEYFQTYLPQPDLPRVRRNMSYDLRGDVPIPYVPVSPWQNAEVGPIYNRPLHY